jgi:hypothetical protein
MLNMATPRGTYKDTVDENNKKNKGKKGQEIEGEGRGEDKCERMEEEEGNEVEEEQKAPRGRD